MKVLKFGGTSLANWERFLMVAGIIAKASATEPVAVVLSAPATVTNSLIELVEDVLIYADGLKLVRVLADLHIDFI